jgi:uncharacterized protein with PQ loop repeat
VREHKIKLDTFVVCHHARAIYLFYGPIRHTVDAFFCMFFCAHKEFTTCGKVPLFISRRGAAYTEKDLATSQ